jgi:hypothetical protein
LQKPQAFFAPYENGTTTVYFYGTTPANYYYVPPRKQNANIYFKKKSAVEHKFDEIMQESAEENLQNLEEMFAPYKNVRKAVCLYGF